MEIKNFYCCWNVKKLPKLRVMRYIYLFSFPLLTDSLSLFINKQSKLGMIGSSLNKCIGHYFFPHSSLGKKHLAILVPRGRDAFGQHKKLRHLDGPDFLSMHKVFMLYFKPIRIARFDNESVNHGLPALEPA